MTLFATPSRFREHTRVANEITDATRPPRPLYILGVLETKAIRSLQSFFLQLCSPEHPILGPVGFSIFVVKIAKLSKCVSLHFVKRMQIARLNLNL